MSSQSIRSCCVSKLCMSHHVRTSAVIGEAIKLPDLSALRIALQDLVSKANMMKAVKHLTLIACCLFGANGALACSFIYEAHELNEELYQGDSTPPSKPIVALFDIDRGTGPQLNSDGPQLATSCDDLGVISMEVVSASDNSAPQENLGFEIHEVGEGVLPNGLQIESGASRAFGDRRALVLSWIDGSSDQQEPFEFYIRIRAVDLAGNKSEFSDPLLISHPGF